MPPSRATLPSSPRFSVEHRRQLVLPSLSLSRTIGFYRPPPPSFTPDFSTRRDSPSFSLSFERFQEGGRKKGTRF